MTFEGHSVFPFRIDHARNLKARWLNDPLAKHLSPAPRGFLDGLQTQRKRRLDATFTVAGEQVAEIETFLLKVGTKAFWLPDLPRDIVVVAYVNPQTIDVRSGDVAGFFEAGMAYAITAMPHDGGDPLMAAIDSVLQQGDDYRLTLKTGLQQVSSDTHELGFAALVAIHQETLSFTPVTTDVWDVSLELTEQPAERANTQPERVIYYRYFFNATDHLGTSLEHRYTTAAQPDGNFEPLDISHSGLTYGLLTEDNECTVSLQAVEGGPFAGWSPLYLGPPLKLTVERKEIVGGEAAVTTIFRGTCVEAVRQGAEIEARFTPQPIKGRIPNVFASTRDNFDPWRTHVLANFGHEVSLISKLRNQITVTWDGSDPGILEGGFIVYAPEGGLAEVRDILKATGINHNTAVELRTNFSVSAPLAGAILTAYEGYDGSPQDYKAKFGSLTGFGGHPRITTQNPSFKAMKLKDSPVKGGKK